MKLLSTTDICIICINATASETGIGEVAANINEVDIYCIAVDIGSYLVADIGIDDAIIVISTQYRGV